jgi:ubiquitin-protein ligase
MSRQPLSKRVPKEVVDAQAEAMRASGIYYWADEADMRKGKALIIGPEGTPYAFCPLLFRFELPDDYPFTPPRVQVLTSDHQTRFHPNLYVEGKVCLSILGTWSGPKWSPVMTLSTVLSSIQSLLEANPIVNEPGYERLPLADPRAKGYAELVQARLVELSVRDLLAWKAGKTPSAWLEFQEELDTIAPSLLGKLEALARVEADKGERSYSIGFYGCGGGTRWKTVVARLEGAGAAPLKLPGGGGL